MSAIRCIEDCPRVHIPVACRNTEIVIGIDEAGRGPVLGSLVYCAAFWPLSEHDAICKLGFDDSKQVKELDRERLFHEIWNHGSIGWVIEELTAVKLSEEMLRASPTSLNVISYDGVVRMLERIKSPVGVDPPIINNVYIDTVGDPETYKHKLVSALGKDFANFVIEKKADATYKPVSAASIIAKVTRDSLLKNWKWAEGPGAVAVDTNYGSGYPGDEACVQWLKRSMHPVFGFPTLVRFSWSTTRDLLEREGAAEVKWECDDDDSSAQDIKSMFTAQAEKRPKKSSYFPSKKMKSMIPSDLRS